MSCCHDQTPGGPPGIIKPADQCPECAEKHLATAYALACETGYADANRPRIIGELTLAQWHIDRENPQLALAIREIRAGIQKRKSPLSMNWADALAAIDKMVTEKPIKTEKK